MNPYRKAAVSLMAIVVLFFVCILSALVFIVACGGNNCI